MSDALARRGYLRIRHPAGRRQPHYDSRGFPATSGKDSLALRLHPRHPDIPPVVASPSLGPIACTRTAYARGACRYEPRSSGIDQVVAELAGRPSTAAEAECRDRGPEGRRQ